MNRPKRNAGAVERRVGGLDRIGLPLLIWLLILVFGIYLIPNITPMTIALIAVIVANTIAITAILFANRELSKASLAIELASSAIANVRSSRASRLSEEAFSKANLIESRNNSN